MRIPDRLQWMRAHAGASRWLDELPDLVDEVAQRWDLDVGVPYDSASVSWVAPAVRHGDDVVLKLQWPHPECEHEAAALVAWAGDGAVALLAHDPIRSALLLERCSPGDRLASRPDVDAVGALVDLLPRLWIGATEPLRPLADEATRWRSTLWANWTDAGEPCERRLVEAADVFLRDLPGSQGEPVLLHQDLHGDNVLASDREPWLVIDPKPLVGEREFGVAAAIRDFTLGAGRAAVQARFDRLTAELGLDRERTRGWTVAQTIAWSFDSSYADHHHATTRFLLDH